MKILFLCPQTPFPPRQGTALRNLHMIQGAAQRHQVALLSFHEQTDSQQATELGPLRTACESITLIPVPDRAFVARIRDLLFTRKPDMARRLWSGEFDLKLREVLAAYQPDIVQIEGIEMAPYLDVIYSHSPRPLLVFDDHNAEYMLQRRAFETDSRQPKRWLAALYSLIQYRRLRKFESETCRRSDRVIAVSDADQHILEHLQTGTPIHVIPNSIDVVKYSQHTSTAPSFTMLFTGKMDYRPNVDAVLWFSEYVWPLVRQTQPEATFGIVGRDPHPRLSFLQDVPGIVLTGEVENITDYIRASQVYVIPLRMGSGTRFKLLEAMASSVPVVSTSIGAEGVPVENESHLLLADDPPAFAAAINRLLDDDDLCHRLTSQSRELVTAQYDWRHVTLELERVYQ